ncbi:outer membrane lipoprotein [Pluralibacter gergoviae]|nr:outer membrane lipoprotein [Pluralibacter gergoviae]
MKALAPLAVLISALLLQGCIAAAVVGTAAVGTKTATDARTVGTQVDDGTLELRVNSALNKDEQLKKEARISVMAYQGKVLLMGQAPSTSLASQAKQIAMGVDGATEVFNEIRQGAPIGLGTASSDTWITTKVRSQLAGQRSGEILLREGLHRERRSVPDGAGYRPRSAGGGRYRQPG